MRPALPVNAYAGSKESVSSHTQTVITVMCISGEGLGASRKQMMSRAHTKNLLGHMHVARGVLRGLPHPKHNLSMSHNLLQTKLYFVLEVFFLLICRVDS